MMVATTVGASSAPMLSSPTNMARVDVVNPTVSAARCQALNASTAAAARLIAVRANSATYHQAAAPFWLLMTQR
jgi:hypothetical protein